jgi:lipopolysaccharide export system protein LptA
MARWQRHARLGFGVFALLFGIALWFLVGERQPPPPSAPVPRIDPKAVSEIKDGDVIQVKGAKRDVRVEFATQVTYSDGSAKYTGFKALVDDRGGRSFEISGKEAQVAAEQRAFDVRGDVTLKTSDGLTAATPHATFTEADGLLRGDGPITFQRARVNGSGVGFQYERSIDRLELRDKAVINVAPAENADAMAVTAGSAAYSRAERFMRFERGTRMERQHQIIEADASTVFLLKERDEPETVELRGNAKITGAAGKGSLQAMQARDIDLRYAADGRTLQQALLVGQSHLQLARPDGSPGQRLDAETTDVTLAPDGHVTGLVGRESVRLTVPPTQSATAREITSQTLDATGSPGRGLRQMVFENNVVYREDVKGANPRIVRARTLNASLSETDTIDEALFSGGFTFEAGRMTANSLEAIYNVTKGTLELRGPEKTPPHIKNDRVDLRAATIDAALSPLRLTAAGKVSALFTGARRAGERGASVLSDNEPIHIVCDKLTFDDESGAGSYVGTARLSQEASGNEIRGDTITMNEKTGVLTASGRVMTLLPLARTEEGSKGNSIARAGEFTFDEAKRRAVYLKDAHLEGSQGTVHANRIELALAAQGNDLQQLTADGSVRVSVEGREATGQRLVYDPASAMYVLNGTPVTFVQSKDCQETTGRALTFYRGSDKITMDGKEARVETKGGKCLQPASKQ